MALPPTTGAPLNLYVPPFNYGTNSGDVTWDVPEDDNWNLINNFAATVVLLSPTASQTISQPVNTYLNLNAAMAYGALPVIRFGVLVNIWDTSLSRTAAGVLSIDSNTPGNGNGSLIASRINAKVGYQFNGAAPNGHILVGNGTDYVDSATIPSGAANYQILEQAGTPITQRNKANFLAPLTAVDNAGLGTSDVGVAPSGVTAGSYTAPTISVDAFGRITAAVNSSLTAVTNANGSYIVFPDGTYLMWGSVTLPSTGNDFSTVAVTFPHVFTATPTITGLAVVGFPRSSGSSLALVAAATPGTNGFTVNGMCAVPTGGGGATFDIAVIVNWSAMGK